MICSNNASAVRRSRFGRRASTFSAVTIVSWNAVSFVDFAERSYFGSWTCSMRRYLRTVLRDRLVVREISRTDFSWRKRIRRILPIIVMVITSHIPAAAA